MLLLSPFRKTGGPQSIPSFLDVDIEHQRSAGIGWNGKLQTALLRIA